MNIKTKLTFAFAAAFPVVSPAATVDTTAVELQSVVVTGTRGQADVRHLPMTVSVVGRDVLTEHQRTNILPTLTEHVPGLFTTSRGVLGYGVSGGAAGGISVRGLSGGAGQLLVLIDGQPQYQGVYGHPIADSYLTLMADRVEVVRGPASVLYGSNAMGGVVNIVTRAMHADGVRTDVNLGAGSWGTFQAEASNQLRAGRFSSTVAAQYQRSDNHRPRMGFEQYGGHVRLGCDLSRQWSLFAVGNVTHFSASNPGEEATPMYEADQWITRGAVAVGAENHYERTSGRLSFYDNFGTHKINDGYAEGKKPQTDLFRSTDYLLGVAWYQSVRPWDGTRLTVGLDYQHIYGRAYYTDRATGDEVVAGQRIKMKQAGQSHRNELAGYVELRQDLTSWLTLDAAVRVDRHSVSGTEWIPQGGLAVRPTGQSELKAMVSKGFRNPSMREMYLYPPSTEELEPERMMNYELSWHHSLGNGAFTYGLNLFYMKGSNMIVTNTALRRNENSGPLENKGFELEAAWRVGSHWTLTTNHSYLDMKHPVLAAPRYKGYLGATFRHQQLTATAGLMQVGGLYTDTGDNERKEHFTLLNATVGYQLLPQLGLYVKGENLLAQRYEINAGFPMPRATFMAGVNVRL